MPEDMLLHGKLINDGGHNLFQRDPPPSFRKKRRRKYVDKEVEVDDSLFENAKQAGAYSSAVQLVLSLMTYASNVVGAGALAYVPIGNLWVVLEKTLKGEATAPYVAVSMAISVALAAAALWYGTMNLEKEMKK